MAWVTLRCPKCGAYVGAPAYPTLAISWVTCPHCANALRVIAPRDPAPLFTWEVYPNLYPSLPAPRAPSRSVAVVTAVVLAGLAILLAALAGTLGGTGVAALGPTTYQVGGNVTAGNSPLLVPAVVRVTGENGFNETVTTGSGGRFVVPGVPAGGVLLNVSAYGYEPTEYSLFLSPVYSSVSDPQSVTVDLTPGTSSNTTFAGAVVYGDMEGLLTGVWSGAGVSAIGAVLAGVAAVAAWRRNGPTWVLAGAAASAVIPFAYVELGIPSAFPDSAIPLFSLVAAGVAALTLGLVDFAWTVPMETER